MLHCRRLRWLESVRSGEADNVHDPLPALGDDVQVSSTDTHVDSEDNRATDADAADTPGGPDRQTASAAPGQPRPTADPITQTGGGDENWTWVHGGGPNANAGDTGPSTVHWTRPQPQQQLQPDDCTADKLPHGG